ncbi:hypothetical protein AC579_8805 [Pseudocercospora musae]|uniref:Peptidase A1 domain-containing protein n=1 Tax=Pseudocercospora musae TaxID=113226 RepID=A0A139HAB2_9PEZI|nr:hypothetical protein AC579_8805 [Pseudocercospora musae]
MPSSCCLSWYDPCDSCTFRFLPSISGSQIWLPCPGMICNLGNASLKSQCLESRGVSTGSPALDKSSSWTPHDMFYFDQHPKLFGDASGKYGQDTIALVATSSSRQAVADRQVIAEYGINDYWVGLVGMAYRPTPFGKVNVSSPLASLLGNSTILSLSFGYTAGSVYVDDNLGSLTLGGYDASRRSPQATENLELHMDRNTNELKVELLDISVLNGTTSGERMLIPPGKTYSMFLDTSVSEFWLPSEVCDLFKGSFNITEDPETGLFEIDNASRQRMFNNNTSLTFVLGASRIPLRSFRLTLAPRLTVIIVELFPVDLNEEARAVVESGGTVLELAACKLVTGRK